MNILTLRAEGRLNMRGGWELRAGAYTSMASAMVSDDF